MELVGADHATIPTIYLVGNSPSSVRLECAMEELGWTAVFSTFFDSTQVAVVDAATSSQSVRAFRTQGLWDGITAGLKPGDVVLIQFYWGTSSFNGKHSEPDTLPGVGSETQNIPIDNTGKAEVVHTYGWYIREYIRDIRSRGATPVVLSWPTRDALSATGFSPELPESAEWARTVAEREQRTSHLDLAPIIAMEFEKADTAIRATFLLAQSVIAGLKSLLDSPVSRYLSPSGFKVMSATERSFKSPSDPNLLTLWIIGDSTVRNGYGVGTGNIWGWGDLLTSHLRLDKINVVNRAVSGRSSRTYHTVHWPLLLPSLRAGDLVLMQFGHNDVGVPDNNERARAPLPGIGSESVTIANPITGLPEVVHTYGWYLRKMIEEARALGALPIVCTLVPQLIWSGDKIVREIFAEWARTVAIEENAPLINLNSQVAECYEQLGKAKASRLFKEPPAHTNLEGALLTAEIVVELLRALNVLDPAVFSPHPQLP